MLWLSVLCRLLVSCCRWLGVLILWLNRMKFQGLVVWKKFCLVGVRLGLVMLLRIVVLVIYFVVVGM